MASVQGSSLWLPSRAPSRLVKEDICVADPADAPRDWVYDEPAIGFVLSGCFEYRVESGSIIGAPGAMVFGNAGEHFSVRHLDTRGNKRLVVSIKKDMLEEVADACGLEDARFRLAVLPPSSSASRMFGWMRRLALGLPDGEETLRALMSAALGSTRHDRSPERVTLRDQHRIQLTLRHIEARFHEACTLKSLSELAGLSRFHFARKFHDVVGQSPNQYLINTRIRAAADGLLTTSTPIAQVALDVGFNDISHFYACFKAAFGCTPRQWRVTAGC